MRRFSASLVLPVLLTAVLPFGAVQAQTPVRTPLSSPIEVTGQTGGAQSSACGYIGNTPAQVIQVTEPFASLNFEVQSTGDYTLLIRGPQGFNECVLAHDFDGGVIQSPGVLNQGTYQVYIGNRSGTSHPYQLRIR